DRVARPDHRVRALEEHVERPGLERAVLPVVRDARQDLARPRERRAQPDVGYRQRLALARQALERRAQAGGALDDADPGGRRTGPRWHGVGEAPHAAIGEEAWQEIRLSGDLKGDELHDVLPSTTPGTIPLPGPSGERILSGLALS